MRGILPETIRTRTVKIGFQSPLSNWMNGALGNWVLRRSQTKHFLEGPVANGRAIRDFIAPRHAAKNWDDTDARLVWRHLQADLWREAFFTSRSERFEQLGNEGSGLRRANATGAPKQD